MIFAISRDVDNSQCWENHLVATVMILAVKASSHSKRTYSPSPYPPMISTFPSFKTSIYTPSYVVAMLFSPFKHWFFLSGNINLKFHLFSLLVAVIISIYDDYCCIYLSSAQIVCS